DELAIGELALDLCAKLQPQINIAILESINAAEGEQSAKSLYLKAVNLVSIRGCHEATFMESAGLLRRSIELDASLPYAPAFLSLVLAFGYRVGVLSDREAAKTEALAMAEAALELNDFDTNVLGYCGCALADVGMLERGILLLRKSLHANDTNPQAWVALGAVMILTGNVPAAVEHLDRGMRVSPLDGCLAVWRSIYALALILNQDPIAAESEALLACEHNEKTHMPRIALAAARLLKKDARGAQRAVKEAFRIRPDLPDAEIRYLVGPDLTEQLLSLREPSPQPG
ncbi:MAG: hypothetical protein AAF420_08180, partial [Pseudomonadota bacterium]